MWALGDYPRIAREIHGGLGPELVAACGIRPGQRVLDVGTGSGPAAIAATRAGAQVVAVDLAPELLEAGRREAAAHGVDVVEWMEADAEALPFADSEFDVVLSCLGAMFAPHHQQVAAEMLRVCRPGGTVGMINWSAQGAAADFFVVFAPYTRPMPPGALPSVHWGEGAYVRELFGGRVSAFHATVRTLRIDLFATPEEFCAYHKAYFGPAVAAFAHIEHDPACVAALDRELLAYARRANRNGSGEPARYDYDYLVAVARTHKQ